MSARLERLKTKRAKAYKRALTYSERCKDLDAAIAAEEQRIAERQRKAAEAEAEAAT